MTTQTYHEASRALLAQAESELAAGDARQASEKGWGAAAQMVKAIADQRGWEHGSHRLIWSAVNRLADESGDDDIHRLFRTANHLHINFYENVDSEERVADGLLDVRRLLDKLDSAYSP